MNSSRPLIPNVHVPVAHIAERLEHLMGLASVHRRRDTLQHSRWKGARFLICLIHHRGCSAPPTHFLNLRLYRVSWTTYVQKVRCLNETCSSTHVKDTMEIAGRLDATLGLPQAPTRGHVRTKLWASNEQLSIGAEMAARKKIFLQFTIIVPLAHHRSAIHGESGAADPLRDSDFCSAQIYCRQYLRPYVLRTFVRVLYEVSSGYNIRCIRLVSWSTRNSIKRPVQKLWLDHDENCDIMDQVPEFLDAPAT